MGDLGGAWADAGVNLAALIANVALGNKANSIANKQLNLAKDQFELEKKNTALDAVDTLRTYDKEIAQLEGEYAQTGIDIRDAESQVKSYDMWLGNYQKQYAQEVASKQAQTDQLKAAGKESYDNFLNAIGYSDAQAGATGRVGANTSQAKTTGMLDRQLVDYVGADRTLDANGGLYGSQLTAANLEMGQLKTDLGFQWQEATTNRSNVQQSLGELRTAQETIGTSITNTRASQDSLAAFVQQNFGDAYGELLPGEHSEYEEVEADV
ncbi:MAG: hypothetical protein LBS57_05650 [Treponema sp.]|jgi:hypothetical protein|nr:hypothetical protein [Treponema sp.]